MSMVVMGESDITRLINEWLTNLKQPKFDKILILYQYYQSLYKMQKKKEMNRVCQGDEFSDD